MQNKNRFNIPQMNLMLSWAVVSIGILLVLCSSGCSSASVDPVSKTEKWWQDPFVRGAEDPQITHTDRERIRPVLLNLIKLWEKNGNLDEQISAFTDIQPLADEHKSTADRERYRFNNLKEGPCIICIDLNTTRDKILDVKWINCES